MVTINWLTKKRFQIKNSEPGHVQIDCRKILFVGPNKYQFKLPLLYQIQIKIQFKLSPICSFATWHANILCFAGILHVISNSRHDLGEFLLEFKVWMG